MNNLVPQEINSETKVGKSIYLFDFFFLVIYMAVSLVIGNMVHESLRFLFYVYSFLMALFFTGKSFYNQKRRNYESIAILIRKDLDIYYPVINISKKREVEK